VGLLALGMTAGIGCPIHMLALNAEHAATVADAHITAEDEHG
jgi:hypothetical protein